MLIGEIPVKKLNAEETIPVGNYEIRIEPDDTTLSAFTTRARINSGVLTAIDKTFLPGALGSAYTLTLEKASGAKPEIEITSIPDGALITIDSVAVGTTPYRSNSLTASEHEVEIQKEGFAKKTLRVRTVQEHVLVISTMLGTGEIGSISVVTPTLAPTTTVIPSPSTITTRSITILSTPNNFLRVRSGASTSFSEVGRVKPGDKYDILDEKSGWYQIKLDNAINGWVSNQFARKN